MLNLDPTKKHFTVIFINNFRQEETKTIYASCKELAEDQFVAYMEQVRPHDTFKIVSIRKA